MYIIVLYCGVATCFKFVLVLFRLQKVNKSAYIVWKPRYPSWVLSMQILIVTNSFTMKTLHAPTNV